MSSTTPAAPGFRKRLYLHDPTPEELAADAAEEEKARKASQKAAKKSLLSHPTETRMMLLRQRAFI
jgi:hypothetical protein